MAAAFLKQPSLQVSMVELVRHDMAVYVHIRQQTVSTVIEAGVGPSGLLVLSSKLAMHCITTELTVDAEYRGG